MSKKVERAFYLLFRVIIAIWILGCAGAFMWRDIRHAWAAPIVPVLPPAVAPQANVTAVITGTAGNTLTLYWQPAQWPHVLQYCIYQGPKSGAETKQDCMTPDKFVCPVFSPPINPTPPPGSLCWQKTLAPNTGTTPKLYFFYVTTVGESAPSNEVVPQQNPTAPAAGKSAGKSTI